MRWISVIFISFLISQSALANTDLVFHFQHASFNASDNESYVELFFLVPVEQLRFRHMAGDKFSAAVNISYSISANDEVLLQENYTLQSESLSGETSADFSLIDLKRHNLDPGVYTIEGIIKDANNPAVTSSWKKEIKVRWRGTDIDISDIVLVDQFYPTEIENSYSKWGFDIIPYAAEFIPSERKKLSFYAEIYNSGWDGPFLLSYSLKKKDNKVLNGYRKMEIEARDVLLTSFDISELDHGDYTLVVEARDSKNDLINSRKMKFSIKPAPYEELVEAVESWNEDDWLLNVSSLTPISNKDETQQINALLKEKDFSKIKEFYLEFWLYNYASKMMEAWKVYQNELKIAEQKYSTIIDKGFETDRGYIFLKYGTPDDVVGKSEAGAIDYEIWQYFSLPDGQNNVRFVFYNPSRVPEDFELLHSTAIGEIKDPQWKFKIYEGFGGMNGRDDIDATDFRDHHGSQLDELFGF